MHFASDNKYKLLILHNNQVIYFYNQHYNSNSKNIFTTNHTNKILLSSYKLNKFESFNIISLSFSFLYQLTTRGITPFSYSFHPL